MGDSTFVTGGIANSDTRLVGILRDESGINISGYEDANLVAVLDNEKTFLVNDYYVATQDDFTSGYFSYPIFDLSPGIHQIQFKARDNYNNESAATITFEVGREGELLIENLINFPNPFSEKTTIRFSHSRSGEDLQAQLSDFRCDGSDGGKPDF